MNTIFMIISHILKFPIANTYIISRNCWYVSSQEKKKKICLHGDRNVFFVMKVKLFITFLELL